MSNPLTPMCPIARPAYGFLMNRQLPGSIIANGQGKNEITHTPVVATHHELRDWGGTANTLYCIFCAQRGTVNEWQLVLDQPEDTGARS